MKLTLEKQWETFHDRSYYDMFAVRMKSDRGFNSQTLFHVPSKAEANALCDILNGLQGQLDAEKADNKLLREALVFYADHDWEDAERFNQSARPNPHDLALPARAALTQPKQKPAPCKTCEGCGKELNPAGSPLFRDCSDCNGTGREVK